MIRERALKIVMVVLGLLFVGGIYPIVMYLWRPNGSPGDAMMLSLYVTLGFFLLFAVRNPREYRALIAYGGWANIGHTSVMALMAINPASDRRGLLMATAGFGTIGVVLIALLPIKRSTAPSPVSA